MSRARTGLLALLLPLLACDEPGTVTMRSVEMRQVGGTIVLTGALEVADVAMQTRGGANIEMSPVAEEEEFRAGAIDDGPRPRAEHPDRVDCGACTCDIVTWTCDCTQCRALGAPAT